MNTTALILHKHLFHLALGLDPAGLHFERYNQHVRLDASDAEFVDIIHSNGASLLEMGTG